MHTPNPWTHVWLHPKAVMRDALAHGLHKTAVMMLSLIFGFLMTLSYPYLQQSTLVGGISFFQFLLVGFIGAFLGPLLYYGVGTLIGRIGALYGGNGDIRATQKAMLFALFMPGILLGFLKLGYFGAVALNVHFFHNTALTPIFKACYFLLSVGNIWVIGLFLFALAEAQQIKLWRAFFTLTAFIGIGFILFIMLDLLVRLFL